MLGTGLPGLGLGSAPDLRFPVADRPADSLGNGAVLWCVVWKGFPAFPAHLRIGLFSFSFFSVTGWGIDLDYCNIEWFALETNRDHSVIFEIASKYCISDSFVDHDGCSISSNGFLPTVVDIMHELAPHERLHEILVVPREKTPTGAAARGNP